MNEGLEKQLEGIGVLTENKNLATALLALITANQSTIRANTERITALDTRITEYLKRTNAATTTSGKTHYSPVNVHVTVLLLVLISLSAM